MREVDVAGRGRIAVGVAAFLLIQVDDVARGRGVDVSIDIGNKQFGAHIEV